MLMSLLMSLSNRSVEDRYTLFFVVQARKVILQISCSWQLLILFVNLMVANFLLISNDGGPHSCSAFLLPIEDTAPKIILDVLY